MELHDFTQNGANLNLFLSEFILERMLRGDSSTGSDNLNRSMEDLLEVMVMTSESLFQSPLWEQFEQEARQRRRNPANLLADYMRECLEVWQDQRLDDALQQDVRQSGYREEDAVELVRQHRRRKRGQRDAS